MNLRLRLFLSVLAVAAPVLVSTTWLRAVARARAEEDALVQRVQLLFTEEEHLRCTLDPERWASRNSEARRPPPPPPENPYTTGWAGDLPREPGLGPGPGEGPHHGPGHGPPHDFAPPPGHEEGPPRHEPRHQGRRGGPPSQMYPYDGAFRASFEGAPQLAPELREQLSQGRDTAVRRSQDGDNELLEVALRTPWGPGPCAYVLAQHHGPLTRNVVLVLVPGLLVPVGVAAVVMLLALGPVIRRIRLLARQVRGAASSGYTQGVTPLGSDELTELAHAFNAASSEVRLQMATIENREGTLRDFLNNTTHDLMTPLTVLTGHLASLSEASRRGTPPEPGVIEAAMNEAHYMSSLLHNLGAAARLDSGEPQRHQSPVALEELVERAVARLRPIARLRGVILEHATPPEPLWILGDTTLLEQAVSNVIQNAVKHNRPGGHVAVTLETEEDGFLLDVIDDGPGIAPGELERLLRAGERGDGARTRDPEGRGLGLAIAVRVARVHGLELRFDPSEFGGLRVRFRGALDQAVAAEGERLSVAMRRRSALSSSEA